MSEKTPMHPTMLYYGPRSRMFTFREEHDAALESGWLDHPTDAPRPDTLGLEIDGKPRRGRPPKNIHATPPDPMIPDGAG